MDSGLTFLDGRPSEAIEGRSRKDDGQYEGINRRQKTEGGSWAVSESRNKFSSHLLCAVATENNNTHFLPLI